MSLISRNQAIKLIEDALLKYGSMSPDNLTDYVAKGLLNGDAHKDFIREVIRYMKEDRHTLIESLQGNLELVTKRKK